ncbi:hypothetical protein HDU80_006769 [Chytriomyces hyalinus]|nr:hypothetical protein HDU80_006769 [Chytriomyces hyalinus]
MRKPLSEMQKINSSHNVPEDEARVFSDREALQPTSSPTNRRRYCWGKLSLCALLSIIVSLVLVTFSLVSYFVIIPTAIQNAIESPSSANTNPSITANLQQLSVQNFTNESVSLRVRASVGPISSFGISIGVGNFDVKVFDAANHELVAVGVPAADIAYINQPFQLDSVFTISLRTANKSAVSLLLDDPSHSMAGRTFIARFALPLKLMGMTIYSGLPLYKTIAIEKSDPSQNKNDANSSTTMDQMMSAFAAPLNSDLSKLAELALSRYTINTQKH